MAIFAIPPDAGRVDKTGFPTEREAVSRAAESARILGRPISVYRIEDAGTDMKGIPGAIGTHVHLLQVWPDGSVVRGPNPIIELGRSSSRGAVRNPSSVTVGSYLDMYKGLQNAVAQLLVRRADPALIRSARQAMVEVAQEVQALRQTQRAALSSVDSRVLGMFKPGDRFVSTADVIEVKEVNPEGTVAYRSNLNSSVRVSPVKAFASHLVQQHFTKEEKELPRVATQTVVASVPALRRETTLATTAKTLLAYCMELCHGDVESASALSSSFSSAYRRDPLKLRAMESMHKYQQFVLPSGWFATAKLVLSKQAAFLSQQLKGTDPVPPREVQKVAAQAIFQAQRTGRAMPPVTEYHAHRLAAGMTMSPEELERVSLFLVYAEKNSSDTVMWNLWGGHSSKRWLKDLGSTQA